MDTPSANEVTPIWSSTSHDHLSMHPDCSPTKTCKNMVGITFDGLAEEGTDLATAWKLQLERDGKLNDSGDSLRDLVLGQPGS